MIVIENLIINEKEFVKTYSDSGCYIERDGVQYSEAIDPAEFNREYTETDTSISFETSVNSNEATTADLYNALAELGVE